MVKLQFKYWLPFCSIKLIYKGNEIILDDVLIDTGSGGTVFKMDKVEEILLHLLGWRCDPIVKYEEYAYRFYLLT